MVVDVSATPKQPLELAKRDWYPYYAGFTESFVESVLVKHLGDSKRIIDPWSGSGTTVAVCERLGLRAVGVDINPATNVIAFARLTTKPDAVKLTSIAELSLGQPKSTFEQPREEDLLHLWFTPTAVAHIRSIQTLLGCEVRNENSRDFQTWSESVSARTKRECFYLTALFATVRELLIQFRTTNPTWLRVPNQADEKAELDESTVRSKALDWIRHFSNLATQPRVSRWANVQPFKTASSVKLPFRANSFDACLTSPPYATRIDYIRSMLPELAVLGASEADVRSLRAIATGTPVVRGYNAKDVVINSGLATATLESVQNHETKGSRSYYYPWLLKYFESLELGLSEASRIVKTDGRLAIVVQDSYYKETQIDLQGVVVEMMRSLGRGLAHRRDFEVRNLRSRQNPRASAHKENRRNVESLLVFE